MDKEILQTKIMIELIFIAGLSLVGFVVFLFLWFLFIQDSINYVYCLFSRSGRYRKWNGYYGLFYIEEPIMTKKGALAINYIEKNNIDIHDLSRGRVKIPNEVLEPTEEELGKGISIGSFLKYLSITHYFNLSLNKIKKWVKE